MASHIYGIDFGTSNSVLAILNKESRKIISVKGESSVIYFKDTEKYSIGESAIQQYIENNMTGRLLKSVKTLLPQSNFSFTYIFGKKYTAEDLVCLILSHLKQQADDLLGENVSEAVLGRPVVFSEDPVKDKLAEKRLLNAAKKAGFEKVWFQYEPIAAGFLYEQSISEPEIVLIGDFGGGTSDFTLMKLDQNKHHSKDRKSDILHTGGIYIGGDNFDAAVMWHKLVPYFGFGLKYDNYGKQLDLPVHIFRTLCEWEQMAFLKEGNIRRSLNEYYQATNKNPALLRLMFLIDYNLGFSLFQQIEKSKILLSNKGLANLHFHQDIINIEENYGLDEFNEFIKKDIDKVEKYLDSFLEKSKVNKEKVDRVFLTGGSSSLPAVKNIFNKIFNEDIIQSGDNFNSVAQGLALSYLYLKED